jgi:hypothetical protein
MAVPKPCAMWPVVVSTGVNDAIDVDVGGVEYHAAIAAATYYTPATLAEAVRVALAALAVPTNSLFIAAGVNDRLDFDMVGGASYVAEITPGAYTAAALPAALEAAMEAAYAAPVWHGYYGPPVDADTVGIGSDGPGGPFWIPRLTTGPNGARSAWATLGYTVQSALDNIALWVADAVAPLGAPVWAVTVSETGRVTVSGGSVAPFSILFLTGANAATSARSVLGFGAVDTAVAFSATAANQAQQMWFPGECVADDTGDLDVYERAQTTSLAGVVKGLDYATRLVRAVSFSLLPPHKVFIANEGSTYLNEAVQRLFRSGWTRFRWFNDATDLATGTDYVLDLDTAKALPRNRLSPGSALYSLNLKMRKFV